MYIEQLTLRNYRNYDQLKIDFHEKMNVIVGENAQGKTNLLESIYVLSLSRSYRTSKDRELIKWGEDFAKIEGILLKKHQKIPLEIILSKYGKKARKNTVEQQRLSDYIGTSNVVMFAPEDLTLVKGSPGIRRQFMDIELGQIQPSYLYHLSQYKKVLQQRNSLLKQLRTNEKANKMMLEILTDQLIEHATIILERRFRFLELLRKWAYPIHFQISRKLEELEIRYIPSVDVLESDDSEKIKCKYMEKFTEVIDSEIDQGMTLIGPHRDDLSFYINKKEVRRYGSQGQQRTTALSLKLAEIDLIYYEIGEYPILLLDDVLSELDDYRKSHLLHLIEKKVQTFVTTTTVDGIDQRLLEQAKLMKVSDGKIIE